MILEALIVATAAGAVGSGVYLYQRGKGPKPKVPKAVKKVNAVVVS